MTPRRRTDGQRGQVIVIFSLAIFLFMGLCALALDISWYWLNGLRMQRAADAAALAGVVHLPSDPTTAVNVARLEAIKNGYSDGVGGVTVTPSQDPTNPRRLRVQITGPVGTYFARVFGFNSFPSRKDAKAEYVLPVPMGSPDAYYGVFGEVRHPGGGVTTVTPGDTGWLAASATKGTNTWTNPGNVYTSNNSRATSATNNQAQAWGNFGISPPGSATITGIEVALEANRTNPGGTQTGCMLSVSLSWNNGSTYTSGSGTGVKTSPALTTSDPASPYYLLGSSTDLWNRGSWTSTELNNTNLRVRVTNLRPGPTGSCSATAQLDLLRIRVHYTTSTFVPDSDLTGPGGETLTPQGFWGVMHGSGADDINGDKYQPRYAAGSGNPNGDYDAQNYYNYAVEVPAGASGDVYVYDPVFCAVQSDMGTGDRWFGGSTEIWSFYNLYNTQGTLYDQTDDGAPVATSGSTFKTADPLTDPSMNGPSASSGRVDCTTSAGSTGGNAGGAYHNAWYQLGTVSGGASGTIFRLHTTTTDASDPNGNLGANGQNSFALYVDAPGARIYGLGAMEQYSPLPASQSSTFYLAQLDAVHAGKTMEIRLWDIGDTPGSSLDVSLEILQPTSSGWSASTMSWTAQRGTVNGANCDSITGTGSVITAKSSGTQYFQGCWLTIQIPLSTSYSAPQQGWWKIRYNVGTGSGSGFDLTTWQVQVRGNPVHLVLP
jgi:hypothetical protein